MEDRHAGGRRTLLSPRRSAFGPCFILKRATVDCDRSSRTRSTAPQPRRNRAACWLLPSTRRVRLAYRTGRSYAGGRETAATAPGIHVGTDGDVVDGRRFVCRRPRTPGRPGPVAEFR